MNTRLGILAVSLLAGVLSIAACTLMKPSHEELSGGDGVQPNTDASVDKDGRADADVAVDVKHEGDAKQDGDASLDADAKADQDAPDAFDAKAEAEAGLKCDAGKIVCGMQCVAIDDPVFGCGDPNCAPCGLSNADAGCESGACTLATCNQGFEDCDLDPSNGCEVDLQTDPLNCASCGAPCTTLPHMTAPCTGGACGEVACEPGYQDCNANTADGCEANTDGDPATCGTCTTVCPAAANAVPVCTSGICGIQCATGFDDCNNNPADGCEANVDTSTADCGTCGHACALPHAIPQCVLGTCQLSQCDAQYGDCNTVPADGCEINLSTDKNNCGTCGTHCSGPKKCIAGTCQ